MNRTDPSLTVSLLRGSFNTPRRRYNRPNPARAFGFVGSTDVYKQICFELVSDSIRQQ